MIAGAMKQQLDPSIWDQSDKILRIELDRLQRRILETAKGEFFFVVTDQAREFLLGKSWEQYYDPQHPKSAIERHIAFPLADLFATDQIFVGDIVCIDRNLDQPGLIFIHRRKDLATPESLPEPSELWDTLDYHGEFTDPFFYCRIV